MRSSTRQAIQRCSVTRATAAKPMPVVSQMSRRIARRRIAAQCDGFSFQLGHGALAFAAVCRIGPDAGPMQGRLSAQCRRRLNCHCHSALTGARATVRRENKVTVDELIQRWTSRRTRGGWSEAKRWLAAAAERRTRCGECRCSMHASPADGRTGTGVDGHEIWLGTRRSVNLMIAATDARPRADGAACRPSGGQGARPGGDRRRRSLAIRPDDGALGDGGLQPPLLIVASAYRVQRGSS